MPERARSGALPGPRPPRARRRRRRRRRHDAAPSCRPAARRGVFSPSARASSPASTSRSRRSCSSIRAVRLRRRSRTTATAARPATRSPASPDRPRRCSRPSGRRSISCSGCRASRPLTRRFVDAAGGRITHPRHAQDDADAAGAGEVRRALRRRRQPPRRPVRRRADQGQPHPARRRRRGGRAARARRAAARCRSKSRRRASRRSTRRSPAGADIILLDNMTDRRDARGRAPHRPAARVIEISGGVTLERLPGARRDRRRLRVGRRAHAFGAGRRHQLRNRLAAALPFACAPFSVAAVSDSLPA